MSEMNGDFRLKGEKHCDDGAKLQSFTQSFLGFDREAAENQFLLPFVNTEKLNEVDFRDYFDFSELTITYRIRWVVRCLIDEYEETRDEYILTSDWSPEVCIGKNGKQEEPKMPEKLDAPVLSEFELKANEDGSGEIHYFASIPDSIYEAVRYQLIVNDGFEPYYIDAEVKINDGEWFNVGVANSTWFVNGYRASGVNGEDHILKTTDDAWIRIRICNHENDEPVTEWSNIIGTKAIDGETSNKSEYSKPNGDLLDNTSDTNVKKCKVCGICPIQPLGICLYIWIAVILLIVIIIIFILIRSSKKERIRR